MPKEGFLYSLSRSIASYLSTFTANLGALLLFVGLLVNAFYEDRSYVLVLGAFCSLHIISCVLLRLNSTKGNITFLFVAAILNLIWIVSAVIIFCVYKFWVTETEFDYDVVCQWILCCDILLSICSAVCYYFIIAGLEAKSKSSVTKPDRKPDPPHKDKRHDNKHKPQHNHKHAGHKGMK